MEIFLKIPNYFCFSLLLPFGLLYTVVQVVHCTTAPTLKNESGLKSNPPSPCQAECPNVGLHPPEGRVPFPNHTKSQSALLITHTDTHTQPTRYTHTQITHTPHMHTHHTHKSHTHTPRGVPLLSICMPFPGILIPPLLSFP